MTRPARVEILQHNDTQDFEYWADRGHHVFLCREKARGGWTAIVDGDVVIDQDAGGSTESLEWPARALTARTPETLASLVALQENLHVILDKGALVETGRPFQKQDEEIAQ